MLNLNDFPQIGNHFNQYKHPRGKRWHKASGGVINKLDENGENVME